MEAHPGRPARIRWIPTLLVGMIAFGCSLSSNIDVTDPGAAFDTDSTRVEVVSAVVGGKNVFVPSTIVVAADTPYTLSVYNGTEGPHGFAIEGAGVEVVLLPKQETEVALPPLAAGELHRIHCHLHGAHRGGTLVVVPRR